MWIAFIFHWFGLWHWHCKCGSKKGNGVEKSNPSHPTYCFGSWQVWGVLTNAYPVLWNSTTVTDMTFCQVLALLCVSAGKEVWAHFITSTAGLLLLSPDPMRISGNGKILWGIGMMGIWLREYRKRNIRKHNSQQAQSRLFKNRHKQRMTVWYSCVVGGA